MNKKTSSDTPYDHDSLVTGSITGMALDKVLQFSDFVQKLLNHRMSLNQPLDQKVDLPDDHSD